MAKEDTQDLLKFLEPFPAEVRETALWLRGFVWDLYPETNELIYDSYNAVAFGWSHTDRLGHSFCSIAVGRSSYNIHFGFYFGNALKDPEKKLLGKGHQYRYILVKNKKDFPKTYITKLINEAYINALGKVKSEKEIVHGKTIVKAIYAKKRPPSKKKIK